MDWSKAKNILIVALLITNLVLGLAIYNNRNDSGGIDQAAVIQNTVLLLREHGIFVEDSVISERAERLPVLSVKYRSMDRELMTRLLSETEIRLSENDGQEEYRRAAESLLKALGIGSENCVYEEMTKEEGEALAILRFGTEYEGYSLDNAKVYVAFRNGRPEEISERWVEPISMGQNKKRVMPASTAMLTFMTLRETQLRENSDTELTAEEIRVEDLCLVYWLEGYTNNGGVSEDTAVPYWCIRYNGGQRAYIAAYEE